MSRLVNFVTAFALIATFTSVSQIASAKEHARKHVASQQFRRANAAVEVAPDYPSSIYRGGWSAPAGR